MPPGRYTRKRVSEPGLLGPRIAKRFRRTETRRKQIDALNELRLKYRRKVLEERKNRHELNALEFRIKKLHKLLNNRGALDFSELFEEQRRRIDNQVTFNVLLPVSASVSKFLNQSHRTYVFLLFLGPRSDSRQRN